ncbi:MAG: demethoxyubiquinone hydroxylase family protein [candidate division WOR-3 bacterium]|nr:MAG: demethoxyubiquinone hydroxylase family protein [candidate division WOR-3 bacterium]UCF69696.1 MAG: demethoxyubiquinone hydroxylase family protein [candidate division WOR-3 bacterium]
MASKEILDMLNKAIARELQVTIQYMWQHVMWKGVKGFAVKDALKSAAITEMKHAEEIAERLTYLGGTPTTKPEPIFVGGTLKEMLEQDRKDEEGAIALYKQAIAMAEKAADPVTKRMFEKILADEEEHHDTFSGLLEEI